MGPRTQRPRAQRRADALSRERIVATAVEVLDAAGESGLTFRVLTERLVTGPGAIYWHVANRGELLAAATDAVVAAAVEPAGQGASAPETIRTLALGLFDVIDEHPWVAKQLSDSSWQATAPRILESFGRQVGALGVPRESWFTVTSVLVQYVLGAAAQNAANAVVAGPDGDRTAFLDDVSATWEALDPDDYPFTRSVAGQMRDHDDREQFLAGVDLVLAGIATLHLAGR